VTNNIRNFCIIAHIDHGKSTLADRLIQRCGGVADRDFRDQILDSMDIERERGITIKSNSVALNYKARDGQIYQLNLIDTPGHVDFSHEVRRSLMSCEGALLVVDASQGVEAQTVANLYLALEYDLEIVPVINKIDLPSAEVERVKEEIEEDLGLDSELAVPCSAKTGLGIDDVLEAIVQYLPPPKGDAAAPLRALIFDAQYDVYRGVVLLVRIKEGTLRKGQRLLFMHSGKEYTVEEAGLLQLKHVPQAELAAGAVGYVIAGVKTVRDIQIGDTVTAVEAPAAEPLPGYKEAKPVVFSSVYPMSSDDYEDLAKALDKLAINDAALTYEKDSSNALGFGFRCGFLGLLHLDVVQERLKREHDLALILSSPSVRYTITLKNGKVVEVDNPAYFPDPTMIEQSEEPYIKASIMIPERYLGAMMELCRDRRGQNTTFHYLAVGRVELTSELPLAEVLFDFYDRLKSLTQGYGSFDYDILDYRPTDLSKVDILVNGEPVDALAQLVHRDKARARALRYCDKLAETIPRQQFKIAIQGVIGGTVIARATINAFRKDVTAKCYGGDITRKRKLLEKQKEGKKRMKIVGSVEIPQEAFVAVLKSEASE
jgi:GTP-binding protein LepA